jgi:hypothetical protein
MTKHARSIDITSDVGSSAQKTLTPTHAALDNSLVPMSVAMKRVEIMCGLFEMAFEIKSLELRRRNPEATDEWIRNETLRLIDAGSR